MPGGDERAHRAGFGDAFFENLAVLRFLVIKQRVHVDRFVELADAGINSDLAKQGLHAEGAGFVGNDGNDKLADLWIPQQLRQQADENHGGRDFAAISAFVEFLEMRFSNRLERRRRELCAPACTPQAACGAPACTGFPALSSAGR